MKRLAVVLFLFSALFCGSRLLSYQWPVRNIVLTATFGESRWTHFHDGVDLGGGEQDIFPIDEGEVLFRFEEKHKPGAIPSGLGSFIVLEHNQRIRSLYAHLKADTMITSSDRVSKEDVIGTVGETGGSYGKHLHLSVIDSDYKQIINPLVVMPSLIDSQRPRIENLYFLEEGELIPLEQGMSFQGGERSIYLEGHDISQDVSYFQPIAPYGIFLYVNGRELVSFTFEGIRRGSESNVLVRSDDISFEELYYDDWIFNLGNVHFLPGEALIEVIVTDLAGNEAIKSITVQVLP